ncbi:hypothetical protein CWI38_1499p0010 [Hamiltosporidium tvaerminnensis]|uniref:Uncharacterized protein n=2 Tax=Hamiltosporidium TaxID=1176354 RepID=A0A4Q9LGC3_9MICR|nr:hypothetical protein LUQ84_002582 [Hamiltosporidium tvaerminnensis]TBU05866.1 hypothetical protein CWI39_0606p0020 [Hamiltosporidium magnivora]TBU01960.1 hypothetical protein CWI37_0589p0030 [Hamiltosporidium tvaerminnensis]TBU06322.1 hypothetical protein CWI36_0471p0040 [Hamiltosporidium magnivora]TBU06475.1 hypothetical protein CWI36_0443p0010 [Hamiltosporidium magnivora]
MSKKIQFNDISDLNEIFNVIEEILPPKKEEDILFLKKLRSILKANSSFTKEEPKDTILSKIAEKEEERDIKMVDLAFSRRDLPLQLSVEYQKNIQAVKNQLQEFKEQKSINETTSRKSSHKSLFPPEYYNNILKDILHIKNQIPVYKTKLDRTKEIILSEQTEPKSCKRSMFDTINNIFNEE